eukprot:6178226-Pleurochrysis_carterae.AAC.2
MTQTRASASAASKQKPPLRPPLSPGELLRAFASEGTGPRQDVPELLNALIDIIWMQHMAIVSVEHGQTLSRATCLSNSSVPGE